MTFHATALPDKRLHGSPSIATNVTEADKFLCEAARRVGATTVGLRKFDRWWCRRG
jgi:hypothetical protein